MRRHPARGSGLKLHLGCGLNVVDGWENIDKSPNVYLSRVPRLKNTLARLGIITETQASTSFSPQVVRANVTRGIPYGDGAAAFIYSSHLIEHISRWQAVELVRECARVLAPGGVLRIATPDLATLVSWYQNRDFPFGEGATPADKLMSVLATYHDVQGSASQRLIHKLVSAAYHQWLYDAESLCSLLEEGGLPRHRVCGYQEGDVPELEKLEQRRDSLFVEAQRA
jgi:predicted SAM-dependent methyltransferase